jgi:hypothetical protein
MACINPSMHSYILFNFGNFFQQIVKSSEKIPIWVSFEVSFIKKRTIVYKRKTPKIKIIYRLFIQIDLILPYDSDFSHWPISISKVSVSSSSSSMSSSASSSGSYCSLLISFLCTGSGGC